MAERIETQIGLSTTGIVQRCLSWHDKFDREIWHGGPSFHNAEHVRTTMKAAEMLIKAALSGNDPLNIRGDLAKWNRRHRAGYLKEVELSEVVRLAFACHDLGNIAKEAVLRENSEVDPVFLMSYMANGAEERSQDVAAKIIQGRFSLPVQHMIGETRFQLQKKVPFNTLIRVVDQIGNDLFSMDKRRIRGLIREMRAEDPKVKPDLHFLFNFSRVRFGQLVPDENKRQSILKIWDKELPEERVVIR